MQTLHSLPLNSASHCPTGYSKVLCVCVPGRICAERNSCSESNIVYADPVTEPWDQCELSISAYKQVFKIFLIHKKRLSFKNILIFNKIKQNLDSFVRKTLYRVWPKLSRCEMSKSSLCHKAGYPGSKMQRVESFNVQCCKGLAVWRVIWKWISQMKLIIDYLLKGFQQVTTRPSKYPTPNLW